MWTQNSNKKGKIAIFKFRIQKEKKIENYETEIQNWGKKVKTVWRKQNSEKKSTLFNVNSEF